MCVYVHFALMQPTMWAKKMGLNECKLLPTCLRGHAYNLCGYVVAPDATRKLYHLNGSQNIL